MVSLAGPDLSGGLWVAGQDLKYEGTTADAHEGMIRFPAEPTADAIAAIPAASGYMVLASADLQAATAFWGADNAVVFEGATANDHETSVTVTDPTGDRTITFPDASGVPILANAVPEGANAVWGAANGFYIEGATADNFETAVVAADPTTDNVITLPDYTGGVPLVVQQGYTQFTHSEATTVDVTGAALTLADGWFTEGKTFKITAGGTVTGANGNITVALYLEDAAVCTLTTGSAAAGDWTAEFTIISTGAATQRIIGQLVAGAGADPVSDYAADTTDTAAAGTVPLKLQAGLAHADDAITVEYWRIEYWNKAD
jgi:hypothetical protein